MHAFWSKNLPADNTSEWLCSATKKKMIHEGDVKRKVTAIQHSASGLLQTPCSLRSIPIQATVEMTKSTTDFSQSLEK